MQYIKSELFILHTRNVSLSAPHTRTHTHTSGVGAVSLFNSAYMQPICKSCLGCLKWVPEQCHKKKTNDPLNAKLVHFQRIPWGGWGGAEGRLGKTSHECKRQRKILPRSKDNKLLIFIGLEIPAAPAAATGYKREREKARGGVKWVG